ncbi:beta-lactamase family protein [Schlegelella sp. S2-27]|uniref:Beta-lactamase family protein n=1 Tax=Caldimonas mangrovi TaxID=2944811 RepID=A0ABT0YVE6_9BURK|nr:serine hydrolase domain-containing protein [Caldimonas mangrovi]MCM5682733.1 beta-lactamase family protein [Caldimonas mangrovi]
MITFNKLADTLREDAARGRIPGAVSLIAMGGTVARVDSCGWLDGDRSRPMTDDAIFWIASMTKPVTTVAALMLVERRQLRLSDPVSAYLPQLGRMAAFAGGREATVLDLMRHTAGFTYGWSAVSALHLAYQAEQVYDFAQTNADMLGKLARLPLLHPPGTVFEYGMSTDVLGAIVEVCSGEPLDELLASWIFEPLQMTSTGFRVEQKHLGRVARPFAHEAFAMAPPAGGGRWLSGGGGLWSTAPDYHRFAQMLLNDGELEGVRLLDAATVRAMKTQQLPPGVAFGSYADALGAVAPTPAMGQGFGLGLSVRLEAGRNPLPGSVGDFTWPGASGTNFWCDPRHQLVVVVMMQAPAERLHYRAEGRRCVYADLV